MICPSSSPLSDPVKPCAWPAKIDHALNWSGFLDPARVTLGPRGNFDRHPESPFPISPLCPSKNRVGSIRKVASNKHEAAFRIWSRHLKQFVPGGERRSVSIFAKVQRLAGSRIGQLEGHIAVICHNAKAVSAELGAFSVLEDLIEQSNIPSSMRSSHA